MAQNSREAAQVNDGNRDQSSGQNQRGNPEWQSGFSSSQDAENLACLQAKTPRLIFVARRETFARHHPYPHHQKSVGGAMAKRVSSTLQNQRRVKAQS
jgi:hypothetical protein